MTIEKTEWQFNRQLCWCWCIETGGREFHEFIRIKIRFAKIRAIRVKMFLCCSWVSWLIISVSNPDQGRADDAGGIAELMLDDGRFEAIAENMFRHFRDAFGVERIEV